MTLEIDNEYYFEYTSSDLRSYGFQAEWLLPDCQGGFASQTLVGSCARRYHSLFLLNSPQGRINILPQIEEFIQKDSLIPLSTNVYQGAVYPDGYMRIQKVLVGPTVRYYYAIGESTLVKEIFKPHNKKITYIRYRILGDEKCYLIQIPLFSGTPFHSLRKKTSEDLVVCKKDISSLSLESSFYPTPIYIYHSSMDQDGFSIQDNRDWFYNFMLQKELDRGLDCLTDFYAAIKYSALLQASRDIIVAISDEYYSTHIADSFYSDYDQFYRQVKKKIKTSDVRLGLLSHNQDTFFIKTNRCSRGIVAGYHWFEEWGRDSFITLSFLTRDDIQNESFVNDQVLPVFSDFISHSRSGILPNRFISNRGEGGQEEVSGAEFNSVDSLLWAVIALYKIYKNIPDKNILKDMWISLSQNIEHYITGTDYGIHVNSIDSLLYAGNLQTQLTWMDARIDGVPVTPRYGACVEINALFYNALRILEEVSGFYNDEVRSTRFKTLSEKTYAQFRQKFMLTEKGYLADRLYLDDKNQQSVDLSFRPNQLFALSLPFPLLTKREGRVVMQKIENSLVTKFGLRTLAPNDQAYRPVYQGGVFDRDSAYHQGTVWPWLLGAYVDAVIEYGENDFRPKLEDSLDSLITHLRHDGIGYVSEVFGGDDDRSGGAIAQCWSGAAVRYCLSRLNIQ